MLVWYMYVYKWVVMDIVGIYIDKYGHWSIGYGSSNGHTCEYTCVCMGGVWYTTEYSNFGMDIDLIGMYMYT